jgi:hypothetical protein
MAVHSWFRVYNDLINDPKIQRLSGDQVKFLLNLWCLASKHGGVLPPADEIAFALRVTRDVTDECVTVLQRDGLLDVTCDGLTPHNWSSRQFKSDMDHTASQRSKKYRDKKTNNNNNKAVTSVTVTEPSRVTQTVTSQNDPVTVTRLEQITDTDNRAEQTRACARTAALTQADYDRLEEALRKAAGIEQDPSPSLLNLAPMLGLLDAGYSLATDILPTVKAVCTARRAKGKSPPFSWDLFVPIIHENAGRRKSAAAVPPAGSVVALHPAQNNTPEQWESRFSVFRRSGQWITGYGPHPNTGNCFAPREVLEKWGWWPKELGGRPANQVSVETVVTKSAGATS